MLEQLTTYVADVRRRLLWQYRKSRIAGMLEVFGAQAQELEDALWAMLLQTSIGYYGPTVPPGEEQVSPAATGIWLDWLGARVGEPREGLSDGEYATQIAARVLCNNSSGTIPELLEIIELASYGTITAPIVTPRFPAGLEIDLGDEIAEETAQTVLRKVRSSRAAGVGVMILHNAENDAGTFTFSSTDAPEAEAFQGFGDSSIPATGGRFAGAHRA